MRAIFNLIWVVSSLYLISVQASPAADVRRGCRTASEPSCDFLLQRCVANPGIWGHNECIAAATCSSVATVFEAISCTSPPANPKDQPSLDYNLYAGIVGDCAWAPGGCPITPQNYIDFYYRTLSNAGSPVFPDVSIVNGWWNAISSWANTGSNVPYLNFNDWLHSSSAPAVVATDSKAEFSFFSETYRIMHTMRGILRNG